MSKENAPDSPLTAALALQQQAAAEGFDWPELAPVFAKLREELAELEAAYAEDDAAHVAEEMGDLLFVCVNLARQLGLCPEATLAAANTKFAGRYAAMKALANERGQVFKECTLEEMEALWQAVKNK